MTQQEIEKGLECCTEFLCGECPYQKYDSKDYPIRCMQMLVNDIYVTYNNLKELIKEGDKNNA